tara:strand:+ start:2454 stop:2789 length:336 start_codon:yes stop_codon:yes gene_type:complete
MVLSRSEILAAEDSSTKCVAVPEWGGDVLVGTITGAQRDSFESTMAGGKMINIRARLVALACRDDSGKRLFTDKDVAALGEKNAAALDRLFTAALKHNAFSAEDVEEIAGN